MESIKVKKDDVKKAIYFISNLTQMQGNRPMQGALSSKADYMGGIFDRWINIIPEGVIFNKIILPKISNHNDVRVITDYYDYNPKNVGIAPDVIGILVNKKAIPFVQFNNKWTAVEGMPQIEVKTFKKNQKMISLRNQNYDDKYLVLAETDFRVDYLIPLIDKEFFSEDIYSELYMNDDDFIISNKDNSIAQPRKIDLSRDDLGTIRLLYITTAKDFMEKSTKCEAGISVEYFADITENQNKREITSHYGMLKDYCSKSQNNCFKLNDNWYDRINSSGIVNKNNKMTKALDFYISNIESIEILKMNNDKMIIKALSECIFGNTELKKGKIYDVAIGTLDRKGNSGEEYFAHKASISIFKDYEKELLDELKKIINSNI